MDKDKMDKDEKTKLIRAMAAFFCVMILYWIGFFLSGADFHRGYIIVLNYSASIIFSALAGFMAHI